MRFSFNTKWLQNILLAIVLLGAVSYVILEHELIMAYATPELFFFAVLTIIILLVLLLFFVTLTGKRASAIAEKRTESLLETQKLFVELYRNSPVPYVMVDHRGRVTYPNHAALHLFGLEEDSFEGRDIFEMFEVVGDEDGTDLSLAFSRFSRGVFVDSKDVLIKRADGSTRYGLLSIFPYGNFGAKKKGLMTIVDITKQKEIEKAKSEFVSVASHQLRTPVSSAKWNLELLQSPQFGQLSTQQQQYVAKIERGLAKMNALIDDFLNVSQLELGTKKAEFERVELGPFFDAICEEFEGRVAEKDLAIEKRFDERISSIETDPSLLHMVVSNLVSNATKYTPEGGTIVVQYTGGSDTVSIRVADNGIGIPADQLDKLFTKFFRAKNVRAQVTEGTGLGLYIVKLAVDTLGGRIDVRSKEGEGTEFTIVLPYSGAGRMLNKT